MPQDWFAAHAPKDKPASAGDWFAANAPKRDVAPETEPQPPAPRGWFSPTQGPEDFPVYNMAKGAVKAVASIPGALYHTVTDPVGTVKAIGQAQGDLATQAKAAYGKGDYLRAAVKGAEYLLPVVGPMMSASGDKMERGDVAEGIGELATNAYLTMSPFAPKGVKTKPSLMAAPENAKDAAAVRFARQEGVPLDLGTATGNQVVKNAQKRVGNTIAGDAPASALQQSQADQLTRVGTKLSEQAGPTPHTPYTAGESIRAAITKGIEQDHAAADTAYSKIKALEQKQAAAIAKIPASVQATMDATRRTPLAVDVSAAMKEMLPLYNQLKRESELGIPMQGAKGRTLAALDGLMNGPSVASLSTVDAALSDLKAMSRGADMAELRTSGQATAAQAVQKLDAQVRAAAAKAGPDVLAALNEGRAATKAKYVKADVLDMLSGEPGQVYRQLTQNKDSGVEKLRAVQQVAPKELPNIARAYLEDLMQTATQEGGFGHADKLWSEWNKLGPEAKKRLFPDKGHVEALDNFFLLAKRIKENPNPSGTAQVLNAPKLNFMEALAYVPAKAMAQMLFNPKAVNYLTQARMVGRAPSRAAQAAAMANLTKAAQSAGLSLDAMPAFAETDQPQTRSGKER